MKNTALKLLGILGMSLFMVGCSIHQNSSPTVEKILKESGVEYTPYRLDFFGDFKLENRPTHNRTKAMDFIENVCVKGLAKCKAYLAPYHENFTEITADNYKDVYKYLKEVDGRTSSGKPLSFSIYIPVSQFSRSKILDSDLIQKLEDGDGKAYIGLTFDTTNDLFAFYSVGFRSESFNRVNNTKAMIEAILRYQNKDLYHFYANNKANAILYPLTSKKTNPNHFQVSYSTGEIFPPFYKNKITSKDNREYIVGISQGFSCDFEKFQIKSPLFKSPVYADADDEFDYVMSTLREGNKKLAFDSHHFKQEGYISKNGSYNPNSFLIEYSDPDSVVARLYEENPEETKEAIVLLYELLKE